MLLRKTEGTRKRVDLTQKQKNRIERIGIPTATKTSSTTRSKRQENRAEHRRLKRKGKKGEDH